MNNIFRFDIAAIIVSFAISFCFFTKKTIATRTVRSFSFIIIVTGFASFLDIVYYILAAHPQDYHAHLFYLIKILYQISFHTIPISFCACMTFVANGDKFYNKKIIVLTSIPYLVCIFLIVTTKFTHFILYFTDQNQYFHGKLSFILYLEALFYITLALISFSMKHQKFNLNQKVTVYSYTCISTLSLIFQTLLPQLRFTNFVVSISILLGYLALQNPGDYIDKETGVYNKAALISNLSLYLEKNKKIPFLAIRISKLQYVYDILGRENRAALMQNISTYLQSVFDKKNIYRITNSRIAVVLSTDETVRQQQLHQVLKRLKEPFKCGNTEIALTFLTKLVFCPEDAQTIEDIIALLEHSFTPADNEQITHADPKILEIRRRETLISHTLEKTIETNSFDVLFQPIYCVERRGFTKAEALVRINSPELGYIMPDEFIPIAEKNGMMLALGTLIFKKICQILQRSQVWKYGIETINIKLSKIQCIQENLSDQFLEAIDYYRINHSLINFEIPETILSTAGVELKRTMRILTDHGISFTLDSYGTGSSNLATIVQYPFTFARFDRNTIWESMDNEKADTILNESNAMLKDLSMKTIAVGIENKEQARKLVKINCDYLQGFFYSYPLSEQDFIELLKRKSM